MNESKKNNEHIYDIEHLYDIYGYVTSIQIEKKENTDKEKNEQ